jgi:hypothetical protein
MGYPDFAYIAKLPINDAIQEYEARWLLDTMAAYARGFDAGLAASRKNLKLRVPIYVDGEYEDYIEVD